MDIKCMGCGAIIQTKDESKSGYIEKSVLEKHHEEFYCKRCFNLRHYSKNNKVDMDESLLKEELDIIKKDKGLVCLVADAFDFEGTIHPKINTLLDTNNILLVLNKYDLYIKDLNLNKLLDYIRLYLKKNDIKVKDILLVSGKLNKGIDTLIAKINELRNGKNVYFVGMSDVGKSTLINQIIYNYTGENDVITVSSSLNTTLGNIFIPLDDKSYIVDTPGIINHNNLVYYVSEDTLKKIMPSSYIKPKNYQLSPSQSLFISGFMRLDFLEGEKSSFTCSFSDNLVIHRTKLANADMFYEEHKDDILLYPTEDERLSLGEIHKRQIVLKKGIKTDVVMAGLGYVCLSGEGIIEVSHFSKIKVVIRKAIF